MKLSPIQIDVMEYIENNLNAQYLGLFDLSVMCKKLYLHIDEMESILRVLELHGEIVIYREYKQDLLYIEKIRAL